MNGMPKGLKIVCAEFFKFAHKIFNPFGIPFIAILLTPLGELLSVADLEKDPSLALHHLITCDNERTVTLFDHQFVLPSNSSFLMVHFFIFLTVVVGYNLLEASCGRYGMCYS